MSQVLNTSCLPLYVHPMPAIPFVDQEMLLWTHSTEKTYLKQQRKENNQGNLLDQLKKNAQY